MSMRKCCVAAVVLISWFVMLPPPVFPPVKDAQGHYKMNSTLPLSQWLKYKTYDSEEACRAELKQLQPFYRCIRSDDPALKGRAAGAPSTSTVTGAAGSHM